MAFDCGAWIAKYLLCLFNFVFFLAGGVVLGVGIWIAADKHSFISATKIIENEEIRTQFQQFTQPTVIEQASYILIACGAFVFFISFLGYCGAVRESKCLLTCYGGLLIIILILEITAGVLAAVYRQEAEEKTLHFLKTSITKYYGSQNNSDAVTLMWNYLMAQMKCCGVSNYEDFKQSEKWAASGKVVPEACCVLEDDISKFNPKDKNCPYKPSSSNSYWETGCYKTLIDWIMEHTTIVVGVGAGLGLMQLIGIVLAFCLIRAITVYI